MRKPQGPDGWQMAMGCYAACMALSLYQTPEIFQQEAYAYLRTMPVVEKIMPAVLALYALASLVCLFFGTKQKRAALGIVGVLFWTSLGSMMVAGAWIEGAFLSPAGMFEVLGGIGCCVAVFQIGDT